MRVRGAVIFSQPGEYQVVDLELEDPEQGELQVKMVAAGLCHSDDHIATGDVQSRVLPICVGHEGAGVVVKVGPHTPGFEVGDPVVFSFLPSCGRCRFCATGRQNLCDNGADILSGTRPGRPGSYRMHLLDGTPVGQSSGISTFAEYTTVSTMSAIKVDRDLPLDRLCLLGCGVGTGLGSAMNSAEVRPGHTVIVMGVGGVGINVVQGAAIAGASHVIAVDPVAMKRDAALKLGGTHAYSTIEEAADFARSVTNGQGADSAIVTIGVTRGVHVRQAFDAIRKAGTVVITGVGPEEESGIPIPLAMLVSFQKRLQGSLFGQCNPNADILTQCQMYRDGTLNLDDLVTTTYSLDEVAKGFSDMKAGRNLRGVISFA